MKRWRREELAPVVERLERELGFWCWRVTPVGSWRRGVAEVHDLDVLVHPLGRRRGKTWYELEKVRGYLKRVATWVKGADRMMSVDDLFGRRGLRLDLFICHDEADWHSLLAFRTGPAELCVWAKDQAKALNHVEFRHAAPWRNGKRVRVGSEADWFKLAEVAVVSPHRRESQARLLDCPKVRPDKDES